MRRGSYRVHSNEGAMSLGPDSLFSMTGPSAWEAHRKVVKTGFCLKRFWSDQWAAATIQRVVANQRVALGGRFHSNQLKTNVLFTLQQCWNVVSAFQLWPVPLRNYLWIVYFQVVVRVWRSSVRCGVASLLKGVPSLFLAFPMWSQTNKYQNLEYCC